MARSHKALNNPVLNSEEAGVVAQFIQVGQTVEFIYHGKIRSGIVEKPPTGPDGFFLLKTEDGFRSFRVRDVADVG